jgi:HEXXH motif-containing protein
MNPHQLERTLFDGLADGGGGSAAIEALRTAQLSKYCLLIGHLLRHWPGNPAERDALADYLDRARARSPESFAEILGAPLVGGWTAIVGRAERQGRGTWSDFGHLGALAMLACAAAGIDGEAMVPVRDGIVSIPGLGAATVGIGEQARLVASGGRLTVVATGAVVEVPEPTGDDSPAWQPVRYLDATAVGQHIRVGLDDLDPYRHGHHAPPALRLPPDEVDRWRVLFAEAWRLLAERLPERAGELAAGLRTLVPLASTDERTARSATIRHAFGVFGLTRPPSAPDFAVTMVHEFQHSKLSGILDVTPLSDPSDGRRYFAPWRTDPRPLAGLLQGVYAFVGVADTWRALRDVDIARPVAEAKFAEARLQVDRGLTSVEQSGALTPAGERIAARLRQVTDTMLAEPVPTATAHAAEQALERTRRLWLDRNGASVPD